MFSQERIAQIEGKFKHLLLQIGRKAEEIVGQLAGCTEDEAIAMKFLYTTMPLSDLANYSFETFLDYARQGVVIWKQNTFNVPEDLFLNYVLHHRINEEEIAPCRSFFYDQLKDRMIGKTMEEAIIEVNYWSSEEATYQSTDERTASPITVYKGAFGRCGEESTFTVSALRSIGIPARQVYAPRWSHCDDNHAWVEVWCEGQWYFLGACEPEEILNKGWFTNASSRAMLIHSRWFDFKSSEEEVIEKNGMSTILNHLPLYALTKQLVVKVVDEVGEVVSGVAVAFEVLNYSEFYPIAHVTTDEQGVARFTTGLGTLHLHTAFGKKYAQALVDTREIDQVVLRLGETVVKDEWQALDVIAPHDEPIHKGLLSAEQKEVGKKKFAEAAEKRMAKVETFYNEKEVKALLECGYGFEGLEQILHNARGNFTEVLDFIKSETPEIDFVWKEKLLKQLSLKDYRDCKCEVLLAHLKEALKVKGNYENSIYEKYVLNPRIQLEPMTAYRQAINHHFTPMQIKEMKNNPKYIWKIIEEAISICNEEEYPNLTTSPEGCLQIGKGSYTSQKILFVAICRTLGIPARLNVMDGSMEYYEDGSFKPVLEVAHKTSELQLDGGQERWTYFQNWSLAKYDGRGYHSLNLTHEAWCEEKLRLQLEAGSYRIITSNRLPNGNIFAQTYVFELQEGETKEVALALREAKLSDMLESVAMPEFYVRDEEGKVVKGSDLATEGKKLFIWLEESKEPTEHILNELCEKCDAFASLAKEIIFIIKTKEALKDPTLTKALSVLPDVHIYYDDFEENINTLARRMYVDPDKLPLIIMTDNGLNGIYATSGYNVGTADMLLRIFFS